MLLHAQLSHVLVLLIVQLETFHPLPSPSIPYDFDSTNLSKILLSLFVNKFLSPFSKMTYTMDNGWKRRSEERRVGKEWRDGRRSDQGKETIINILRISTCM